MFGGFTGTPARVLAAYPDAFAPINLSDGKFHAHRPALIASQQRDDIMLRRGWFGSDDTHAAGEIYQAARGE